MPAAVTGGRNGYGAKLANIFSSEFTVEAADGGRGKLYKQRFSTNMTVGGTPSITAYTGPDYTCATFKPDLARFGMAGLDADIVALLSKRVVDMAGVLGKTVKVTLNGAAVPVASFVDYVGLYVTKEDVRVCRVAAARRGGGGVGGGG